MSRAKHLSYLATGLIGLLGFVNSAAPAVATEEAALRAQTTTWVKAYNEGDAAAVAALYAPDALLLPPGSPAVRGRAAIRAYFQNDIAGSRTAGAVFNINPHTDAGISGDLGWESGTYTATVKGAVVESGKFLSVYRRTAGKWFYIRDIWNADAKQK